MSSVAHLKKKLKAPKKMLSSWTESPLTGEVEIVIPNKKYKGAVKMTKASPPEEVDVTPIRLSVRRRVLY